MYCDCSAIKMFRMKSKKFNIMKNCFAAFTLIAFKDMMACQFGISIYYTSGNIQLFLQKWSHSS